MLFVTSIFCVAMADPPQPSAELPIVQNLSNLDSSVVKMLQRAGSILFAARNIYKTPTKIYESVQDQLSKMNGHLTEGIAYNEHVVKQSSDQEKENIPKSSR